MLKAYLDESGIHKEAKVCVVAGYATSIRQWKKLERDWWKILKGKSVSEFHAVDFWAHKDGKRIRKPYCDWSEEECNDFINRLINVIAKHDPHLYISAVEVDTFFTFSEPHRRYLTGGKFHSDTKVVIGGAPRTPFHVPMQNVEVQLGKVGRRENVDVHFVCDEQDEYAPLVLERFLEIKKSHSHLPLGNMVHASGKELAALQIADLACYAAGVFFTRRVSNPHSKPDYIFKRLLRDKYTYWYFDKAGLSKLVEQIP